MPRGEKNVLIKVLLPKEADLMFSFYSITRDDGVIHQDWGKGVIDFPYKGAPETMVIGYFRTNTISGGTCLVYAFGDPER